MLNGDPKDLMERMSIKPIDMIRSLGSTSDNYHQLFLPHINKKWKYKLIGKYDTDKSIQLSKKKKKETDRPNKGGRNLYFHPRFVPVVTFWYSEQGAAKFCISVKNFVLSCINLNVPRSNGLFSINEVDLVKTIKIVKIFGIDIEINASDNYFNLTKLLTSIGYKELNIMQWKRRSGMKELIAYLDTEHNITHQLFYWYQGIIYLDLVLLMKVLVGYLPANKLMTMNSKLEKYY